MQVGVIGLQGEGALMVRRLLAAGHRCVVFDTAPRLVAELGAECAFGAASLGDMANELDAPRVIVLAGPASEFDATIGALQPLLERDDIIAVRRRSADGGDSRRAERLATSGIHYVDINIDGPLDDRRRPCCAAIGGDDAAVRCLEPVLALIAPSAAAPSR